MTLLTLPFPEFSPWALRIDSAWFGMDWGVFGFRWYGLAYLAGLLLGWRYCVWLTRRPRLWPAQTPPMKPEDVEALLVGVLIGAVLGGRLGFVIFYKPGYFLDNPHEILSAWNGGMSFHGGLTGVAVAVIILSRMRQIPMLSVGDMIACAAPIGLLFGRLANFINAELYGRAWDGSWAMTFPQYWSEEQAQWVYGGTVSALARHPSQLYEAALEGALLFSLLFILALRGGALRRPGLCIGLFWIGYGLARAVVETFRQPDMFLPNQGFGVDGLGLGLTQGQMLSIPMVLIGVAFAIHALRAQIGDRPAPPPSP